LVETRDPKEQVLALAAGRDATQLDLSAAEGYLLSRIDGTTPWRLLREIGGIPAAEVDACLARWIEDGILDVVGTGAARAKRETPSAEGERSEREASSTKRPQAAESAAVDAAESFSPPPIDESALDAKLELSLDVQRRILEFEASLSRPYHALLGIEQGAPPKAVKRAYFKLSKEFHPDRYFRKNIGSYGVRLDRIFKKVLEAHEILSDPELCKVENSTPPPSAPPPSAPAMDAASAGPAEDRPGAAGPKKARPLTKLERLQQRMPFKINHAAIADRRARAEEIFRAAQSSQQAGRLQEAEASIRIAISFDPGRTEFKEALGSLRIAATGARASKLLAAPSERMSDGELREALTLLEDVLPYRPHDPGLNERAAQVCFRLGKLDAALEYAETLLERNPEQAAAHTLVGRIYKDRGDAEKALRAFERALKYDENDLDARRALASLRIGAHDAARGGVS